MRRTVLVVAKEPRPGFVKTRLTPPLSPVDAAALASACLADTLAAVQTARVDRRVLVLDGRAGPWVPEGFSVVAQRGDGLDQRIANAFAETEGPALVIGMDTPQVTSELIERAFKELERADSVLGPARDGGWWALGLREPKAEAVAGVPMSVTWTCYEQRKRLLDLALTVAYLPTLRDIDVVSDAHEVARAVPSASFAKVLHSITQSSRGDATDLAPLS